MGDFRVIDLDAYLNGLNNIFDSVRIVNPKRQEVTYESEKVDTIIHRAKYQEYWKQNQPYEDCISTRALKEKKILTKIEYSGDSILMLVATPMIFGDDIYLVEMIRDITNIMFTRDAKLKEKAN